MAIDKVLACIWSVSINGVALDLQRKRSITSIQISTLCDGSDTATISISDKDLVYINDNIFIEDATVAISLMFVGTTDKINFNGYISAIDIDFPEDGVPTLSLTCLDGTHVMNRTKKKRSWNNVTRMQVAQKIAAEYGFKFEGESSYNGAVEDTISQSDQTDIEFLEDLASQEDELYSCKLRGTTLYYKKKYLTATPVMTVHYKQYPYEVRSFSPRINKETMQDETTVSDVATDTKKTDTAKSTGTTQTQGKKVSGGSTSANPSSGAMKYDAASQTWINTIQAEYDKKVESGEIKE